MIVVQVRDQDRVDGARHGAEDGRMPVHQASEVSPEQWVGQQHHAIDLDDGRGVTQELNA